MKEEADEEQDNKKEDTSAYTLFENSKKEGMRDEWTDVTSYPFSYQGWPHAALLYFTASCNRNVSPVPG